MGINPVSFTTDATNIVSNGDFSGVASSQDLVNTIDALAGQSGVNQITYGILQTAATATSGVQNSDILQLTTDLIGLNQSNPSGVIISFSGSSFIATGASSGSDGSVSGGGGSVSGGGDGGSVSGGSSVSGGGTSPITLSISQSGMPVLQDPNSGTISQDTQDFPSGSVYFDQNAFGMTGLVLFAAMTPSGLNFYLNEGASASFYNVEVTSGPNGSYQFSLLPTGSTPDSGTLTPTQNVISSNGTSSGSMSTSGSNGASGTAFNGSLSFSFDGNSGINLGSDSTNFISEVPSGSGFILTTQNSGTVNLIGNGPSGFSIGDNTSDNIQVTYGPSGATITDVGTMSGSNIVTAGSNASFSWSGTTSSAGDSQANGASAPQVNGASAPQSNGSSPSQ